ncbi:hypothetical protein JHW43_005760 [Diplocarpon mali]|nr:hypothetical protein JHW43_005760 [Diplocarpon mali]
MSLRHPYQIVYKFCNHFAAPDQASPGQSSRSQGLRKSGPRPRAGCSTCQKANYQISRNPSEFGARSSAVTAVATPPQTTECSSFSPLPVVIQPRPVSLLTYSPSSLIPDTADEWRYFQRFCDKTALGICGSFDPAFWTEKVLQLCHVVAPIRHATIALGALARSLDVTSHLTQLNLSGFPQVDHGNLDG